MSKLLQGRCRLPVGVSVLLGTVRLMQRARLLHVANSMARRVIVAALLFPAGSACGNSLSARDLGEPCDSATPCGSAYSCGYGFCREGCANDKDCSASSCLRTSPVSGVCALPGEQEDCKQKGCSPGLVCAADGACLAACAAGCLSGQTCVGGACLPVSNAGGAGGSGGGGGAAGVGGKAGASCVPNSTLKCASDGHLYSYDSCGLQGEKKADCTGSGCINGACRCGNGAIDPGEECDGTNLGQKTCADYGYNGPGSNLGSLTCADCSIVSSGCHCLPNACQSAGKSSGAFCAGNVFVVCAPFAPMSKCAVVSKETDCGASKTCGDGCMQKYCVVYEDSAYSGASQTINAVASVADLGSIGMQDKISSARCFNGATLTLWVDTNFSGCFQAPAPCQITIAGNVPDFQGFGGDANDNASSAKVQ